MNQDRVDITTMLNFYNPFLLTGSVFVNFQILDEKKNLQLKIPL